MTIDEAIKHCEEVAERQEYLSEQNHGYCDEKRNMKKREEFAICASDHRQLAEWLRELREAKRLLKLAVESFKSRDVVISHPCSLCKYGDDPVEMCQSKPVECFVWAHTDEAKKLLKE